MSKLTDELAELEKIHGDGKFELDPEFQVIKKKGYKCYRVEDIPQIALDTVAGKIAKAEGKDITNATIKANILKRIKPKSVSKRRI